jgi:hypothetical protein
MKFSSTNREETEGETAAAEEPFWKHRIAIKHYFCMSTDWQSVMRSMNQIATALANDPMFDDFASLEEFFAEGSLARSSELLDRFYDYCDERRIWVE